MAYTESKVKTPDRPRRLWSPSDLLVSFLVMALVSVCPVSLNADDGAVGANPAGGLEWTREPRVSMVKERLTITLNKVTVEFEFLNESDEDIVAQVGFPIPPYEFEYIWPGEEAKKWHFNDFATWIDGKPGQHEVEERAFLNGVDHTEILTKFGIDIGTFGDKEDSSLGDYEPDDQLTRLPKERQEQLVKLGLMSEGCEPTWTVRKMHHWAQRFPAHEIVLIRHEYSPVAGRSWYGAESLREFQDICIEDALFKRVKTRAAQSEYLGGQLNWVKYILTSANTWKTPIKDFELIVDKSGADYISFCWDGEVEKLDETRVIARAKDFVPAKELTIYFLHGVDMGDGPEVSAENRSVVER